MRVERFSLFFPPLLGARQARRDRVRDRRDPARRLREDQRHEPARGAPAGGRAPRLLPPAGLEADLRDLRRAGGEHRARVPDPDGRCLGQRRRRADARVERVERAGPAARRAAAGRPLVAVDGVRGDADDAAQPDRHAHVRGRARSTAAGAATPAQLVGPARRARAHASRCARSTTPRHEAARGSASATAPRTRAVGARRGARRARSTRCGASRRDGRDDRADLRRREAQGDLRRRRLLRGHAPGDQVRLDEALVLLALISLSLGVINLFPFLPLDGGHIFWALAEKVRGRAIPFSVMERAGFVGFALVIGAVHDRADERHRPARRRGLRGQVASRMEDDDHAGRRARSPRPSAAPPTTTRPRRRPHQGRRGRAHLERAARPRRRAGRRPRRARRRSAATRSR